MYFQNQNKSLKDQQDQKVGNLSQKSDFVCGSVNA